jgi:hypothetical protein
MVMRLRLTVKSRNYGSTMAKPDAWELILANNFNPAETQSMVDNATDDFVSGQMARVLLEIKKATS